MSTTSDAIIAQLEADHELVAAGSFSLDVAAARDKLEAYRVADPHAFVLLLVEAAHLFPGCRRIEFEVAASSVTVRLIGVVLVERELRAILEVTRVSVDGLDDAAATRMRARQVLDLALITAGQLPNTTIELGSSGASSSATLAGTGSPRFAARGAMQAPDSTWLKVRGPRGEAMHRRELLRARCGYATVPVHLDGQQISSGITLPEVERPLVVRDGSRALALIGRSPARSEATLLLIANGVLLEKLIDHELGAHVIALVHARDLPRDLSMSKLLRRDAYEQRIRAVREAAKQLPADHWPPPIQLDADSDEETGGELVESRLFALVGGAVLAGLVAVLIDAPWALALVPVLLARLLALFVPGTRGHRRKRLDKLGRPAIATVERVLWNAISSNRVRILEILIHVPGERPYRSKIHVRPKQVIEPIEPGTRFRVRVDPGGRGWIVLDKLAAAEPPGRQALTSASASSPEPRSPPDL